MILSRVAFAGYSSRGYLCHSGPENRTGWQNGGRCSSTAHRRRPNRPCTGCTDPGGARTARKSSRFAPGASLHRTGQLEPKPKRCRGGARKPNRFRCSSGAEACQDCDVHSPSVGVSRITRVTRWASNLNVCVRPRMLKASRHHFLQKGIQRDPKDAKTSVEPTQLATIGPVSGELWRQSC